MSNITVAALFTKNSGEPATGLTLGDIDLYMRSRAKSDGAIAVIWAGVNPTEEIGGGLYGRLYNAANEELYDYYVWAEYTGAVVLDVDFALQTVSGGSDHILTTLQDIEDALSDTTVTVVASVVGPLITVVPYTTWEFTLSGLSSLADAKANGVFFTVKRRQTDPDSEAILQVQEGVGLLVLNGSSTVTANKASLTVAGTEDAITVHVNADQTGLNEQDLVWDIKKVITDNDDADQVDSGPFHIADPAVTQALTTS